MSTGMSGIATIDQSVEIARDHGVKLPCFNVHRYAQVRRKN